MTQAEVLTSLADLSSSTVVLQANPRTRAVQQGSVPAAPGGA
jgi:hypothetical protein